MGYMVLTEASAPMLAAKMSCQRPHCGCQVEKNKHFVDFTTREPEAAARLTIAPREGEMVNAQITSLSGILSYPSSLSSANVTTSLPHLILSSESTLTSGH